MRCSRVLIGLLAAACALVVAGCSAGVPVESPTSETPSSSPDVETTPTPTVSLPTVTLTDATSVSVTGDFNTFPTVTAPYPFKVDTTICKTLIQGDGVEVGDSSVLELQYTGIDATSGQTFDSSFYKQQTLLGQNGEFVTGFNNCLTGQKTGSRVLMLISSADGYDASGGQSDAGIAVGDSLLFVVDVIASQYSGPVGQHMADGDQWVTVTDTDGVPTAKVNPGMAAPTELQSTVLTQGTGRAIAVGDAIYVNFFTMDYSTGAMIENSYTDGNGPQVGLLANMIPGWRDVLVGVPMGSRVLIIVPGNLAYPQGNATPSIAPNTTLVCVVDILFSFVPQAQ